MTRKIILLPLVIFVVTATAGIFAESWRISPIIEESQIPMPEIQYELPETLIGEFIMISRFYDIKLTIFPNNKYILSLDALLHPTCDYYGYIIKNDNTWYFSPAPEGVVSYFYGLKEIYFTDSGFFCYQEDHGLLMSMRKENMPLPEHLAGDVSVPIRFIKQQYFSFNDTETSKIDFNQIEYLEQWTSSLSNSWYHRLRINNGIVEIIRYISTMEEPMVIREGGILFEGFLEKIQENTDGMKGIIRFTNGIPYYYIIDGIAEIEINSDGSIIITMLYSPDHDTLNKIEIFGGLEFPAKLILEF